MMMNNEEDNVILGRGLSAPDMIKASPSQHGVALKLHVPLIFGILPTSLKRLVMTYSCFSWLMPQWRQRYLILIGNYLYKFKGDSSPAPKGTPFSVDMLENNLLLAHQEDDMSPAFANLPPGYDSIFTVSTFGKKHYYAVSNRDEALTWVNSLRQSRQEAITRAMGHAGHMPYPKSHAYFDTLGKSLQKSKERINQKLEEHSMREMELTDISGGPRGFYG
ncbi:expressed unknown protein [Seminavis robusta]|uniref:PH domain-containing protein n=1 Tax=Seminavis robusta TaxID=568900 RepID=A0A9N8D824_9STRA|nr:expressed unknown protein [Seminavis robusta]|eukprot:Sro11_g008860.1 n/a (220) ;mRNA; f:177597-178256